MAGFHLAACKYYLTEADSLAERKELREALEWYQGSLDAAQDALRADPKSRQARAAFFRSLWQMIELHLCQSRQVDDSEFLEAERLVNVGLAHDPGEPLMLIERAFIEGQRGDVEAYRNDLARARELELAGASRPDVLAIIDDREHQNPGRQLAVQLYNEGVQHANSGRLHEGIRCLRQALEHDPDNPYIELALGQCLHGTNDRYESDRLLNQAQTHALAAGDSELLARIQTARLL